MLNQNCVENSWKICVQWSTHHIPCRVIDVLYFVSCFTFRYPCTIFHTPRLTFHILHSTFPILYSTSCTLQSISHYSISYCFTSHISISFSASCIRYSISCITFFASCSTYYILHSMSLISRNVLYSIILSSCTPYFQILNLRTPHFTSYIPPYHTFTSHISYSTN